MVQQSMIPVIHPKYYYSYELTVDPTNIAGNEASLAITMPVGVIRHVSIIFPPGCVRNILTRVVHGSSNFIPNQGGVWIGEDNYHLELDVFEQVFEGDETITLLGYTLGNDYAHKLTYHFLVEHSETL